MKITYETVLKDIIATAIILARRDKQLTERDYVKYNELMRGIGGFRNFVYNGNFRIEEALVTSANAVYLAAMILVNYKGSISRFNENTSLSSFLITYQEYNFLNKKLKFIAKGEALYYWNKAINLLFPKFDN